MEVAPFGLGATRRLIERATAAKPGQLALRQRSDGHAFVTDGGHWIVDAALGRIDDPKAMAHALAGVPGVMEHGLFIGLARIAIIAGADGLSFTFRTVSSPRVIPNEGVAPATRRAAASAVLKRRIIPLLASGALMFCPA